MKIWHFYTFMLALLALAAIPIFFAHPFQHLCLYRYETTIDMVPNRQVRSYNIIKMPTVCVNASDEGFARTTRTTVDSGYDTPEVRERLEAQFMRLVLIEKAR